MRISTCIYCLKQGLINIRRNILHSLASIATISACIFLFCMFYAIIGNVQHFAKEAETTVGITVFFKEDLSSEEIGKIGSQIQARGEVGELKFISAEDAWNTFKTEYFGDMEELAEGFAEDNPLAGSASYEVYLKDISTQDAIVKWLQSLDGVRRVNYSNAAAAGLSSMNRMIGAVSALIIGVLLAVAVFLISNTISVAAAFRRNENQIMKLIGATNGMIRAPFVVEGVILGVTGAAVPLAGIYYLYKRAVSYIMTNYVIMTGIFTPVPVQELLPSMILVALVLGGGIGFFGSFFTIRKHLKV